jgi:hypothetical protein
VNTPTTKDRPTFTVTLRPEKHVADPVRALRHALKRLLRDYGMRATSAVEDKSDDQ